MFNLNLYSLSWYSVPVGAVGFLILALGFFVFKQNVRSVHNLSFFLLCLSVFIWLTGYAWIYSVTDHDLALRIYRYYTFLGVAFIAANIYFFSVVWLDLWAYQKVFVHFSYALFFVFYISGFTTDAMIPFLTVYFCSAYFPQLKIG